MLKGKPAFYRKLNQFELSTVNLISKGLFGNLTTPGIIRRHFLTDQPIPTFVLFSLLDMIGWSVKKSAKFKYLIESSFKTKVIELSQLYSSSHLVTLAVCKRSKQSSGLKKEAVSDYWDVHCMYVVYRQAEKNTTAGLCGKCVAVGIAPRRRCRRRLWLHLG